MTTILTSLHGRAAGISAAGDLIVKNGRQITDIADDGVKTGSTVAVKETGDGAIHKTKLTCTATPLAFTDVGGAGQYCAVKLYDFPEGHLCILGAVISGSITLTESEWIDTWEGDIALGSAATASADGQAGTEVDILASTAIAQATAQVAACPAQSAVIEYVDGTATAIDLYLNIEIDDEAAHGSDNGTFTGAVEIAWINVGDN